MLRHNTTPDVVRKTKEPLFVLHNNELTSKYRRIIVDVGLGHAASEGTEFG